jgi:hypothetical protein
MLQMSEVVWNQHWKWATVTTIFCRWRRGEGAAAEKWKVGIQNESTAYTYPYNTVLLYASNLVQILSYVVITIRNNKD